MNVIAWLWFGYALLHVALFAEVHTAALGERDGTMLLWLELVSLVAAVIGVRMWKQNKRVVVAAITYVSLILGYMGWFVLPQQQYERAQERVLDWKQQMDAYRYGMRSSFDDKSRAWRHFQVELEARKLESDAANLRRSAEASSRPDIVSWMLWLDSALLIIAAIFAVRRHKAS